MNRPPKVKRRLLLENLETRTLLAGDVADPYGLVADLNLAMHAVTGTGDFQWAFDTKFGDHRLVLTGSSTNSLTIDLSQLPAFITDLKIASFSDVKLVGTDQVNNLILDNIGSFTADGLTVTMATFTTDVSSLSVASLGTTAALKGSDLALTAHSLDGTTILSGLNSLTLTSDSKIVQFIPIPGWHTDQTLNLTFTPDLKNSYISGLPESSVHIVLPPVDGGHSTPTTTPPPPGDQPSNPPADTSDSGSVTIDTPPSTSPSDTGHVVIISVPLDDRTRALLAQLSQLLHSTREDSDQLVLDLLNHTNFASGNFANLVPVDSLTRMGAHNPVVTAHLNHGDGDFGTLTLSPLEAGKVAEPLPAGNSTAVGLVSFAPQSVELVTTNLPDGLSVPGVVDVDVSWPIVFAAPEPAFSRSSAARKLEDGEHTSPTVAESVSALGSYIVERVSAEFSPGQ